MFRHSKIPSEGILPLPILEDYPKGRRRNIGSNVCMPSSSTLSTLPVFPSRAPFELFSSRSLVLVSLTVYHASCPAASRSRHPTLPSEISARQHGVAIPPEPLVSRHQNSAVLQYRPDGTLNNGEVYVLRMVEDVDLDLRNYESTSA